MKIPTALSLLFLLSACHPKERSVEVPLSFDRSDFREGDVVFRRGRGLTSRLVLGADPQGVFSHTGIVVVRHDSLMIVHAVPGESPDGTDKVEMEPIALFFHPDKAVCGLQMRFSGSSELAKNASLKAIQLYERGTLFDHSYDQQDTLRMYCTELIVFVYRQSGIDLIPQGGTEISLPGFHGKYLLPTDVQKSTFLYKVKDL
ncbi:MAG: hypothetical protein RR202_11045 [Bacteroidales bacterium]